MKKSREFDNILDECLERLLVEDEALEQCLHRFPEHASELKPLLETALATKKVSAIQPRPEFRDKARHQFYLALQKTERRKNRSFFGRVWQPRWAVAVSAVLVLLLAGGGTVAAAGRSMPDEPLYQVKLVTEQVQLALTPSALGKAELYTRLADRRVLEIVRMADESKPEYIEQTAQRLDTYLTKVADLASTQETAGGLVMAPAFEKAPPVKEASAPPEPPSLEDAPVAVEAPVTEEAPPEKKDQPSERAQGAKKEPLLTEQAGDAREVSNGADRRAKLKETVISDAEANPERLRALLETVPESAKPALLKAIAISEAGYEKAIKSLER